MTFLAVSDLEVSVGIAGYATTTAGIGGRIKVEPEDFVVEEIGSPPRKVEGGRYTVAVVRSRNWETNRLVREMARRLAVSRKRISFAGTKDKRAVTTQWFCFELPEEKVRSLHLSDVEVLETYATDRKLEIGNLLGNRFRMIIRDLAVAPREAESILSATSAQLEVL
ncbi:MAG: tRNA pseudouridine(13) synthase TruD, partial [Euryarchaeota archaeon]|nr:tRNA pseudouridine(13) synthase TruD [Euryarchaeota archaeon]